MQPDYASLDRQFLWHPFTPMQQWMQEEPIVIEAGEGFELIDTSGRRYIDGFSSLWCNLHGHRVPQIDQAIREQLEKIAHTTLLGLASPPSIELAKRLIELVAPFPSRDREGADHPAFTGEDHWSASSQARLGSTAQPPLSRVFFSDSGASAVEVALKMAFQYWHNIGQDSRRKFLAFREGYHGDTIGAVSVGGIDIFHRAFGPLLFETTFVDSPCPFYHPDGSGAAAAVLEQIDRELTQDRGQYCAVVIEPLIQAAAGMLTHPSGFLRDLRELTRRHDVLLIADEVATGFGRTGAMFACQNENVWPDLMCLGKGLTGGYLPVSATLASRAIFDSFLGGDEGTGYAGRAFFHGNTFSGNALGCAAAIASIDLMASTNLIAALPEKIDLIRRKLSALADHPNVGDIRQCGMMVGIDLVADRKRMVFFAPETRVGAAVCQRAAAKGIMIRPLGDVVVLMPAPGMDMSTLERLLNGTVESVIEMFNAQ